MIVNGGINITLRQTKRQWQTRSIDLNVGNIKATSRVIGPVRFHLFNIHTTGTGQNIVHGGLAEIIHFGPGRRTHRLRCLFR